ncbi:MAG: hypothetical protein A3B04_03820 [Candidatus Portnoybacteria bacterium RIFCSPLOWO2_02_FULL_39_11]|uniref:Uncharacterized protein n=1 Tax=Candidatus Portnoybacteria bacterium RIFCSPLOWO2_02_FULL_39_11 TaxID=1802001 RepID=A0A1G2FPH9_9BACT|nr:MAG: hypothetical protein A3B04_03820 [Candidatus Portnoybacteria bacterium RIFCSPLOWO2_02_FULL_39_11]
MRRLVRSAAATFEIRSNLFKNVHQKRNRVGSGGSAGCARLRRQRCKGKIQIRREPPYEKNEEKRKN